MERKKWSKGSVWEFCYATQIFGTFGVEMRAKDVWSRNESERAEIGQILHTDTHTRLN